MVAYSTVQWATVTVTTRMTPSRVLISQLFVGLLAILATFIATADGISVQSALHRRDAGMMYVESEEENDHCYKYPLSPDDPGRERAPCQAGNSYHTASDEKPCQLCLFDDTLKTYNPHKNYCPFCVICPTCPEGQEVVTNCTRTKRTVCRQIQPTFSQNVVKPTDPISTEGAVSSSSELTTPGDGQVEPEPEPSELPNSGTSPEPEPGQTEDGGKHYDIRNPRICVPAVTVFLLLLSYLAYKCWKYHRLVKIHAKCERTDGENRELQNINHGHPGANVYGVQPDNAENQPEPDGPRPNPGEEDHKDHGHPGANVYGVQPDNAGNQPELDGPRPNPGEEDHKGACASETDAMLDGDTGGC